MTISLEQLLRILSLYHKSDEKEESPSSNLYIRLSTKKPTEKGKSLVFEGDSRTVVIDLLDEENIRGVEIT